MLVTIKVCKPNYPYYENFTDHEGTTASQIIGFCQRHAMSGVNCFIYCGKKYVGSVGTKAMTNNLWSIINDYINKPRTKKSGWSNKRKR